MRDALGSVQSLLLLGGTSDMGLDIAHALVADRVRRVVLAARDGARAESAAVELRRAGADVDVVALDATRLDGHGAVIDGIFDAGGIDLAVVAVGLLGRPGEEQLGDAGDLQLVNGAGAASLMAHTARRMHEQGHGTIVLLSSVAADRPRASNYAYGAGKAASDAFARGLRDAMRGTGVEVMVVRPGFVRTRMTAGRRPAPGAVDPAAVTAAVIAGLRRRSAIVYVPGYLRWVMLVLRALPGPIFRRLPL
jgi:decaprenylphospho-beta-D-erythro-pentofuranosid-2-ulose 2-reductase